MKKYRRKKKWRRTLFFLLVLLLLLWYLGYEVAKKTIPYMKQVAIQEARNVTTYTLIQAVQSQDFALERNDQAYASKQINLALSQIIARTYEEFRKMDIGVLATNHGTRDAPSGVIYQIPIGSITQIPFLINSGPKISIRMRLLGDVSGNILTKVTPYGINNALVEIAVAMKVHIQVLSIFMVEDVEVLQEIPLSIELVVGEVPRYYPWVTQPIE